VSGLPDYELLYQHAPCSYLLMDDDGTITDINATFLAWTGYQRDDVVGTRFHQLLPVGDRLLYSMHHQPQLLLAGALSEISLEIVDAQGHHKAALLTAVRTLRPHGTAEIRIILFSAHERRKYELDLVTALRREREVIERSAQLNVLKDDFIATINHEFRSPLATVTGHLELIADGLLGPVAENHRQTLEVVLRNTARLNGLVESILSASTLDQPRTAPRRLDLAEVLTTVVTSVKAAAAAKDIQVTITLPDHPLHVMGHAGQLEEALRNVLRNSLQYTAPQGEVSLDLSCSTGTGMPRISTSPASTSFIENHWAPEGDQIVNSEEIDTDAHHAIIIIRDTGIGIPGSDIPHLFTSFFRGSNIARTSSPGSGLGLTITKQILDHHHSRIVIDSTPEKGTIVLMSIPLDSASRCPGDR
jgi:PAS domain S-box-containing protein